MNYHIHTYGCQMNKSDGERIAAVLESAGWTACSKEENADLIIIIACSVRQTAVDRVYGRAQKYAELKKQKPNLKTVLTGCVLDLDKKKLADKFDAVCDIKDISQISNFQFLISNFLSIRSEHKKINYNYLTIKPKYLSDFQAYVPIMTGCNNFCSYCVVPYTRGREYSRPAKDILSEARQLIKNGYKEIFLLGQNVNSYCSISPLSQRGAGGDFSEGSICSINKAFFPSPTHRKIPLNPTVRLSLRAGSLQKGEIINFPSLLRLINSIPGDFWIRFATSHPKDMSDELIDAIAECEKITPYLHLPIQAGSDKILKAMNRKYTKVHYLNLIKKIKKQIPDIMLSTDIIVGFPGETEKDFKETVAVFKKVKYSMAYIARYSPRAGTASYKLKDNVAPEKKAQRENILTNILKRTALENNKKFIGKTVRVLVEHQIPQGETLTGHQNYCIGKTAQFVSVRMKSNRKKNAIGAFVNVKILKAASFGMEGE